MNNDQSKEINEWLDNFYSHSNSITSDNEWKRFRYLWSKFHDKVGYPLCFIYSVEEQNINFILDHNQLRGQIL